MKKRTKTKKRNPQDATLRNIRALKKRVEKLEADMLALWKAVRLVAGHPKLRGEIGGRSNY